MRFLHRFSHRAAFCAVTAGLVMSGVLLPVAGLSQSNDPLVDSVAEGKGRINYAAGVVKATGYGAPPAAGVASSPAQAKLMALGAARADALRTLAMSVSSIQVTAETKVKNYVLEKDVVKTELSALLKSPRIVSESFQADGTAVVVVELPMYGERSIAAVILPEVIKKSETVTNTVVYNSTTSNSVSSFSRPAVISAPVAPAGGAGADANGTFRGPSRPAVRMAPPAMPPRAGRLPGGDPGLTPLSDNGPFTSVIIDCRGLGIEAIMSPKIYDTTGREVYGTVRVSAEYAIETGIVSYPRSMAEAIRSARAGEHPLIVRALRVADRHRFNPVISMEDADRIIAANNRDRFLEQTRVILLVDPVRY